MAEEGFTIIEPVAEASTLGNWNPVVGSETLSFLQSAVPEASQSSVRDSAISTLAKGVPPSAADGQLTGLVIGYVQSGKTMSFETVTALARDNGFPIVIVVAGISNPLLDQSTSRLSRDLRLDEPGRERRWIQFPKNPGDDEATIRTLRDVLDEFRDESAPEEYKKTVLITVLKNHRQLPKLTALLSAVDLRATPVLVIDDEADQASLNTEVAQGQESSTYRRLMELRQALPNHTYLQYTATPQAPLLISIIDELSPDYVELLEPGEEYVGGREFFSQDRSLIRVIPQSEVPTNANPLSEPPESLLEALRVFMVGMTIGMRESSNAGNRSMLVHPSHRTSQQQEFYNWVRDAFEEWKRILALPEGDADKLELLAAFRDAYDDLAQTADQPLPFDEVARWLPLGFRNTRILEVNTRRGSTPQPDWRGAYGWILVGGQAMDRGFTVEGLTVTYMPRGIGVGNADTVQQRARFFGYKRKYLGHCRVYLEQGTVDAFESYVAHEEDIREQLTEFQDGRPLSEWKRAFVLDSSLRPCRNNVLEFDYMRGNFSDQWVNPAVVLGSEDALEENRIAVAEFVQPLAFEDDEGHPDRSSAQRHEICQGVALREVLEELLVRLRITGVTDSRRNTGLLLQLSRALEDNPDETCTVVRMSPGATRQRSVDENGEIANLFQGAAPTFPVERRGEVYPGDREIRDVETVTIQLHMLELTQGDQVVAQGVPVVAVWVPARMALSWIVQDQTS